MDRAECIAGSVGVSDFLVRRIEYLFQLPNIGSGWIAGGGFTGGEAPSEAACSKAAQLLIAVGSSLAHRSSLTAETLIMGPVVDGGVELEMRFQEDGLTVYLTLRNTGEAELTLHSRGVFDDLDLPWAAALELLIETLGIGRPADEQPAHFSFSA
jgi:hypothetical protein